jgi:hypothetical protein
MAQNKIPTPPLETPVQIRDAIRMLFDLARENSKSSGRGKVLSVLYPRVDYDGFGIQFYSSNVLVVEDGSLEIDPPVHSKFVPWPLIPQIMKKTNTIVTGSGTGTSTDINIILADAP